MTSRDDLPKNLPKNYTQWSLARTSPRTTHNGLSQEPPQELHNGLSREPFGHILSKMRPYVQNSQMPNAISTVFGHIRSENLTLCPKNVKFLDINHTMECIYVQKAENKAKTT